MDVRILHCGGSFENYYICVSRKIFGFTRRIANIGDEVYLVVKVDKKSMCGARGILSEITDERPWKDADLYPQAYMVDKLEFCEPFNIEIMSEIGGKHWGLKYAQGSKKIVTDAANLLNSEFLNVLRKDVYLFDAAIVEIDTEEVNQDENSVEEFEEVTRENYEEINKEVPDMKVNIMGTFLTVKFHGEQDQMRGLEALVNDNFYSLFEEFPKNKTILIPENRLFVSEGAVDSKNKGVKGTKGIPDGILINFNSKSDIKIQVNLLEYKCYGEKFTKAIDKFEFINGTIIPQLMRYASTFSVITDSKMRDKTIKNWTDKIAEYVFEDEELLSKFKSWIKQINPSLSEFKVSEEMKNLIREGFESNLRIILIIDELSLEEKETIRNIVNAFKLENKKSVEFLGFVVRLVQKINLINTKFEYALAIQK